MKQDFENVILNL